MIVFALVAMAALSAAPAFCGGAGPVKIARDISYIAGGDPKYNTLDIYSPAGQTGRPVIVFIHGGGWRNGDKDMAANNKGADFALQGYIFVSINYRLVPAVHFPDFAVDCAQAVAWVHEHIADYGGDPDHLFVMGHSAGAHLAALISTDPKYLTDAGTSTKILSGCVLLDSAGYDLSRGAPADLITRRIYLNAFGSDPAVRRDASPIAHISTNHAIPPFLIFYVATRDTSRAQSEMMQKALKDAHVSVEVKPAYDKTHRTLNTGLGTDGDIPTEQVLAFLAGH
ncbi:alpha/beta hydrolase [Capsulimonas corticalis]|nr:alpha/beta hydrolase [Capsulimonas corticalis]